MKQRLTYIVFLLMAVGSLQGQSYFNRIHAWGGDLTGLLVLDSGYVTMLRYQKNFNGLVIREYGLQGQVVDSAYYLFDDIPFTTANCLFQFSDQKFIGGFSIGSKVRLIQFNRQWDTLKTNTFQMDTMYTIIHSLYPDSDSTFVASGWFDDSSDRSHLYLCRLDTALNLLWEKRYYDTTTAVFGGYYGGYVVPVKNKGYLIGVGGVYPNTRPNKSFIIRTDAAGNELWKKEFSPEEGIGVMRLGQREDGNFIYVTSESLDTNYRFYNEPMILRFGVIDSSGTILEDKHIGPILDNLHTAAFTQTIDGHFVIGGYTYVDPGKDVSYLFKFTEDGDSIWHRKYWYGYPEGVSIIYAAKATPDTGLITAGEFFDSEGRYYTFGGPTNYTWLMKLDQYGCDTAGCHKIGLEENAATKASLKVYPNPAKNYLVLEWEELQEKVTVKVFTNTGQLIYDNRFSEVWQKRISTELWPVGIYHLQTDDGTRQSSITLVKE